ncbi:hypothetical protein DHD32_10260 [Arenibacter sp. TNZ]|uniref:hypothetical protein n=1 Tax=Arenibacter TaxID=178469 RepID=UPI000CD4094E|nr:MULTISPECIES: hypothetical protein [Arenibacter]MCM4171865.1 hypothetical protein [Arenibacter sp. TNZ]
MNHKKTTASTYRAEITIGLNKGYTNSIWSLEELKAKLTIAQENLKTKTVTLLSAKVSPCDIVFLGQNEKSVTISFINYPKFPLPFKDFKAGVLFIGEELLIELKQNRIVIVFADETVMFEIDEKLDDSIKI